MINDRYEIGDKLGAGAMGDVFKATDTQTGQTVAIKRLKPALVQRNPQMLERFRREGEALRQLDHPNTVKMLDTGEHAGSHYIVMEYVDGGDLHTLLTSPLAINEALTIAIQIADALTRTHFLDILHRDIKPANVLIASGGTPKLTDFGIAAMQGDGDLTETGAIMGTIAYLSPEGCMGQPLDKRSDVWSFGVLLYEMLIGKRPFDGDSTGATILSILQSPLPDISTARPDIPDALADLLYRMLDKSRDSRIPSVRLVGVEIEALLEGSSQPIKIPQYESSQTVDLFDMPTPTSEGKHNLPAQITPFVGRTVELDALDNLINEARLNTILGPGGMGKSRLSIEVGLRNQHHFEHGAWFVELAKLSEAEAIPSAVAEALELQLRPDGDPRQQVINYFANKNLLLILDNFEHILEGRSLVTDILEAAPQVTVIVTSRERLMLSGETVFTLHSMDFPEWETPGDALEYAAVQLFMQSAKRARIDFELEADDLTYLTRICRLVEGIPLGILLAAAWVDALTLEEIAEEIAESIDFLETAMFDLPDRHRSMRAAIDYSCGY